MGNKLFIILFLTFNFVSYAQPNLKNQNDWQVFNLKGEVASYSIGTYVVIKDSTGIRKGKLYKKYDFETPYKLRFFNKKGYFTKIIEFDKDTISYSLTDTYKYIDDGKLAQREVYNKKENRITTIRHVYNEKGEKIRIYSKNTTGGFYSEKKYKYNKKRELIKETKEDSSGFLYTCNYEYEKGNLVRETSFYGKDGKRTLYTYRYYRNGKTKEEKVFFDGRINRSKKYRYNKQKKLIEITQYNSYNELFDKIVFEYNKNGTLTKKTNYYNDDIVSSVEFFEFDDKGSIKEKIVVEYENNSEKTTRYKFDKKGNWIQKVLYYYDIPSLLTERRFKYYK